MNWSRIDLLCEMLAGTAIIVNRRAVRKQLIDEMSKQGLPASLQSLLVQGFEWRDHAHDLKHLVDGQNKKVFELAKKRDQRAGLLEEKKKQEIASWKTRWDTSYWVPGNPVYEYFCRKK